jgi:hypothetical protein
MKEPRELKDLTMHDVQPISDEETTRLWDLEPACARFDIPGILFIYGAALTDEDHPPWDQTD